MKRNSEGRKTIGHAGLAMLLAFALPAIAASGPTTTSRVSSWVTTADHARTLSPAETVAFDSRSRLPIHI